MSKYDRMFSGDIMKINLNEAINLIKTTVDLNLNPYFFVVGAGISVPEIPLSGKIIDICKGKVRARNASYYEECIRETEVYENDPMKYYSRWISLAYPNRIDRSSFFKKLILKAKISSANLMLGQILSSRKIASTVFTTNFDDKIKAALELIGEKDFFVSENAMDNLVINPYSKSIQIVHVHGTYHFYDCANIESEISGVAAQSGTISSSTVMKSFLSSQAPIIVGYSGWENDVIMSCLKERLNYPTPLSYIWVCYSQNDYDSLPEWLKNNDNMNFVIPEISRHTCDENDHLLFDLSNIETTKTIESKKFFAELISHFKLEAPDLFVNPFSYYSKQIEEVLPEHEDVLHLKHWAQRMQYLGNNESEFEKLVEKMEQASIQNDFDEAGVLLGQISKLEVSINDLKFVCNALIKDLINRESTNSDFDKIITFHMKIIDFLEKRKDIPFEDIRELLRCSLFIDVSIKDKEKYISLINRVLEMSEYNEHAVSIYMAALGVKSTFIKDDNERKELLNLVLTKAKDEECDDYMKQLKAIALLELATIENGEKAVELYNKADEYIIELDYEHLKLKGLLTKSELLVLDVNLDIKKEWIDEICEFLKNIPCNTDRWQVLNMCGNLSRLHIDMFDDKDYILKILNNIIEMYNFDDLITCSRVLDYCIIGAFICNITTNNSQIIKYCDSIFKLKEKIPCDCSGYKLVLEKVIIPYCSLPIVILPDENKIEKLKLLKSITDDSKFYYGILRIASEQGDVEKYEKELSNDMNYIVKDKQMMTAVGLYYEKNSTKPKSCLKL